MTQPGCARTEIDFSSLETKAFTSIYKIAFKTLVNELITQASD